MKAERTPAIEKKKSISFEDWEGRIKPALDLFKSHYVGSSHVGKMEFYTGREDKNGNRETVATYNVDMPVVHGLPGFEDLYNEWREQAEASVGGDVTAISGIYERIYDRLEELNRRYGDLRKTDLLAYKVADKLFSKNSLSVPTEDDVRGAIEETLVEQKRAEFDSAEHEEYLDLRFPAERAFAGMAAEAELGKADEEAKKRGFASRRDMWKYDTDKIREFKEKIGEQRFHQWQR